MNVGEHTIRLCIYKQITHKPHLVSLFKNIRDLTMTLHGFPHLLPCCDANEITYNESPDLGSNILAGLVWRDWLTELLASWQTHCGKVWTGLLWGKVGKNLSCLLCWLGNTPERGEKETQTKRMWTGQKISLLCTMWKHSCMIALLSQRCVCMCHLLLSPCCVPEAHCSVFVCVQAQINLLVRSWFLAWVLPE